MKLSISPFSARKGFTLVELLVVVVLIIALTALSFQVLSSSSAKTDMMRCATNMKDLWVGAKQYADDWNGRLPANGMYDDTDTPEDESQGWMVALSSYIYGPGGIKLPLLDGKFRCPSDRTVARYDAAERIPASPETVSYVPWTDGSDDPDNPQSPINIARGYNQTNVPWLSDGEGIPTTRNVINASDYENYVKPAEYRHKEKINVLYVGGAVKAVESPSFDRVFPDGTTKAHLRK